MGPESVKTDIDSAPPSRVRYAVIAALCGVALIAYIQRNSIGVAEESIREDLNLTKTEMAWIMSGFFWSYALMQIPTGLIGQRIGSRRALSSFVGIFSVVAGLFSLGGGLVTLLVARVGMGIGQAGIFPAAVNSIGRWIPRTQRSMLTGMLASSMSIGGAIGAYMMGRCLPTVGWRIAFALFCLPGLVYAIWLYFWFRDRPEEHRAVNEAELDLIRTESGQDNRPNQKQKPVAARYSPLRMIYAWTAVAALCGQQICRAAGYMFFTSWFATYLRDTRGVEDLEVGMLNALPLLAVVVGAPTGGAVADWIYRRTGSVRLSRQGVGACAMLICCGMIRLSYPIADATLAVLAISVGSFFAAFGGPCAYTATIDMGGRFTPLVFGTMNMAGNFGAAAFPFLIPFLSSGDATNWELVMLSFSGLYFAAALCWMLADANASVDFPRSNAQQTTSPSRESDA